MTRTSSSLEWGFTRAFRVARLPDHGQWGGGDPGKWIAFLPSAMPRSQRQEVFDALAADVFSDPALAAHVFQAKMALSPLAIAPDRIALMFYCQHAHSQAVRPGLQRLARRHRTPLIKAGTLASRDGYLGGWVFKTDAQTRQEMEQGTHDAQVSLWMELAGVSPQPGAPRRRL